MARSSSIQPEEGVKPFPDNQGTQGKPFGIFSGRKIVHLFLSFFHALISIVSKIHLLALSLFKSPPPLEGNLSKDYPLSNRISNRTRRLSDSNDSAEIDSETARTSSDESDSDSGDSFTPFSKWIEADWKLVIGVLKNMLDRLKEKPKQVDLSPEEAGQFKSRQAEFRRFRDMHDKLERVLDRMPFDVQDNQIVREFIKDYKELIDRKIERSFAETVYHFIYNNFFSKSSPEATPKQPSSTQLTERPLSSPRDIHTPRGSPPKPRSPIKGSPDRDLSTTPPNEPVETERLRRRSGSPGQSPRINLGGIPQLGNSCYLNAVMQIINEKYLPPLKRYDEETDEDFKKREQLDQAMHLLMQVKNDLDASADEVWLAALVLRNLLFDLGIVPQVDIGELGCFGQQDASVCANGLLQTAPLTIREMYQVDGSHKLFFRPDDIEPAMKEPLIRLPMEPEFTTVQELLNHKFALRTVAGEDITHRTFPKTLFLDEVIQRGVYEESSDSPGSVVVPVTSFQRMEKIEAKEPPAFVCVQLSRFENDGSRTCKNKTTIQWPKSGILDFQEAFKIPVSYKLTGAVLHEGSLSGGHYTAYATRDDGSSWRYYNDICVESPIEAEGGVIPEKVLKEIAEKGYLFFLEKIEVAHNKQPES